MTDGRGTFLEAVELEFLYAGGRIRRIRARPHCKRHNRPHIIDPTSYTDSDVKGEKPRHIYLHYRWRKEQAVDGASGTIFLLVVSVVLTIYSMVSTSFSSDRQHGDKVA